MVRPIGQELHGVRANARVISAMSAGVPKFGALMAAELRELAAVVRRQSEDLAHPVRELVARLKKAPPQVVLTCARGSSGNAAAFGKYLIERHIGVPVAAAAPSIMSVYRKGLRLEHQLFLAISQSGRSEDLLESAACAKTCGALTVALVNDTKSPLASSCDVILPMGAGPELNVAATKTFVASLAALLHLTAAWADERELRMALDRLPDRLPSAAELDWTNALGALSAAESIVTLGRGPTLAIAQEAALKLKEICNIHAEAFSGAEFQHGPISLVSKGYPILIFLPNDASAAHLAELAVDLTKKGASIFITSGRTGIGNALPVLVADHPDTDAVCLIQSFYAVAIHLAQRRGVNIDQPRHLRKITRTR